ncbi:hypothetical protein [Magnetovibrio blakemorei]|uniref:Response regulatory domain-containing protein n=1 Tax=Magnetovibrio blakemorei TaxID=28181 RepID=A0A1E5QA86_9PROT|nr:hypothetical protein [Magnetovibrio blakemorei]OEJ68587.1 hypothetical protein BEN30_00115 [Magnetovibrio blakemorei]
MHVYEPEKFSIVAVCNSPALSRATEIMFKALGFAKVDVVTTNELSHQAPQLNPTFIIFSPEYLTLPVEEMIACGYPSKSKIGGAKSLTVIFLRQKKAETVIQSKEMGFDGIIFADDTMERLHAGLRTVYETKGHLF